MFAVCHQNKVQLFRKIKHRGNPRGERGCLSSPVSAARNESIFFPTAVTCSFLRHDDDVGVGVPKDKYSEQLKPHFPPPTEKSVSDIRKMHLASQVLVLCVLGDYSSSETREAGSHTNPINDKPSLDPKPCLLVCRTASDLSREPPFPAVSPRRCRLRATRPTRRAARCSPSCAPETELWCADRPPLTVSTFPRETWRQRGRGPPRRGLSRTRSLGDGWEAWCCWKTACRRLLGSKRRRPSSCKTWPAWESACARARKRLRNLSTLFWCQFERRHCGEKLRAPLFGRGGMYVGAGLAMRAFARLARGLQMTCAAGTLLG